MQVPVYNIEGEQVGEVELKESIFGIQPNVPVMHQALVRQLANARQGTHSTRTRGEVRGGGRKPWRQKHTGRARQGSIRSPQWVGGGTVFGPKPRSYEKDMPKKMRRLALRSALSVKAAEGQIKVLDDLTLPEIRTKRMLQVLENLDIEGSVLVLLPEANDVVELSARNLPEVKTLRASYLNVRDLLGYDTILLPLASLQVIEQILG
ncbi:MAG: 50S ribosomal protein L4 [Chloroflexi bacterium]|nr:50S ribosomal protein L4 [Chloroflexota bacterium]